MTSTPERIATATAAAVQDLILQHWPTIESLATANDTTKAAVSISFKFTGVATDSIKYKAGIKYSAKYSDEREDSINTDESLFKNQ